MEQWAQIYAQARSKCKICHCCKDCDGILCKGQTPGPGGKGSGSSFIRNIEMLKHIKLKMDTITCFQSVSTKADFFGHEVALPVYGAPISGVAINYGVEMDDATYSKQLMQGCLDANTFGFSGDGMKASMFEEPLQAIIDVQGRGIPTIKPWVDEAMDWRIKMANDANVIAVCSDIDASGLTALSKSPVPVEYKDVAALQRMRQKLNAPFIIKGILSVEGAKKALAANADGIVISNHGGRVLDESVSGIEMLYAISKFVNKRMKVFVDGGFRSGVDVFKALALGADGVLIGRPVSQAIIGGGAKGLQIYFEKIQQELQAAMMMCNTQTLQDITIDNVKIQEVNNEFI